MNAANLSAGMQAAPPERGGQSSAPAAQTRETRRSGALRWVLIVLLVVIVAGQRLAVPLGAQTVPLSLIASCCAAVGLLLGGLLRVDRLRAELFVLAGGACAGVTYLATWGDAPMSLSSFLLLLVLYAPWALHVAPGHRVVQQSVLRAFVWLMLLLSGVGAAQVGGQYSGVWQYRDYLAEALAPQYLIPAYNTSNTLDYYSPVFRGNAFIFLEPSFLSQYCALAIIVALVLRAPTWQLLLLAAGLGSAVSGTGFILLAAGLVLVALRRPRAIRPTYVVAGLVAVAVLLATPFADGLLSRADEFSEDRSSATLRFVDPYTETATGLDAESSRWYVGAGPGTAERLLVSGRSGPLAEAVTYTTAPKLVFEYGLLAGGLFMLFLLVALLRGSPVPVVPGALLVMTWLLSGALLQPHTAVLAWVLVVVWGSATPGARSP